MKKKKKTETEKKANKRKIDQLSQRREQYNKEEEHQMM